MEAVPLRPMGRFKREAVAVDDRTNVIYQTEDIVDGLFYRFIPDEPGKILKGGRVQALAITGREGTETRHWDGDPAFVVGESMPVHWVDLDDVEAPDNDLRYRGSLAGAARIARGEGIWYDSGQVFIAATLGGRTQRGQIWKYVPSQYEGTSRESEQPGTLELFVEPNDGKIVENGDKSYGRPVG